MDLDEKISKTLNLLKNSSNIIEDDTVYNKLHTYLVQFLFQEGVSPEKMEKIGVLELFSWSYTSSNSLKNPSLLSSTLKCMADLMKREGLLQIVNLDEVFNIMPKFKCSCDTDEHLAFKEVESVIVDALLSITLSLATHKTGCRYLLQQRITGRFILPSLVHKSMMVSKKAHEVLAQLLWNSDDQETFSSTLEEIKNFRACDYYEFDTKNEDYEALMVKFYRNFIPLFKFGDRSKLEMISWTLKCITTDSKNLEKTSLYGDDFDMYKMHLCFLSISCSDNCEQEKKLIKDTMEADMARKYSSRRHWTELCHLVKKCQSSMASSSPFLLYIQKYCLYILMFPLILFNETVKGRSKTDIDVITDERHAELDRLLSSNMKGDEKLTLLRTHAFRNQRSLEVAVGSIEASTATWMVHTHLLPMLNPSYKEVGNEQLKIRTLCQVLKKWPESAKTEDFEFVIFYLSFLATRIEFSEYEASLECLSYIATQNDLSAESVVNLKKALEIYLCNCHFDINDAAIDCLKSLVPAKQDVLKTILSDSKVVKASCISFLCTSPFLQENSANFIHSLLKLLPKDTFSHQELVSVHEWCILCVTTDSEDSPHVIAEALHILSTLHTNFSDMFDKSCHELCHRNCFRHITSDVDVLRYAALKYIEMHIKEVREDKIRVLCEDGSAWCVFQALKDPVEYISHYATSLRHYFVTDQDIELQKNGVTNGNSNLQSEESSKRKLEELTGDEKVMDVEAVLDEVLNDPDNESLKKRLRPSNEPAKHSHCPDVTVIHCNDVVNYIPPSPPTEEEISRTDLLCLLEDIELNLADTEERLTKPCVCTGLKYIILYFVISRANCCDLLCLYNKSLICF